MKIKSNIKSGGRTLQHNEKLAASKSLTVKSNVKAGVAPPPPTYINHNEKMNSTDRSKSLKTLKTKLRLGKETIRELNADDLKNIVGGVRKASLTCVSSGC